MVVGVCWIEMRITGIFSLKEKRKVVRQIRDRTRGKFNVSIAEVGEQNDHNWIQIGIAIVGNDRQYINSKLDIMINFIEGLNAAELTNHEIEIFNY